jgi:hypothetical protein
MSVMPDQSFRVYSTSDLTLLTDVEKAVAKYAHDVMTKLGQLQPMPGSVTGIPSAGFFPHGSVDWKKDAFTPSTTPALKPEDMALDYPSKLEPGERVTVVETSEYLVLTQQEKPGIIGRCFPVPNTHLLVYGDVVCIHGKITAPGKHLVIFARELRTLANGTQKAELNVSAEALAELDIPKFQNAAPHGADGSSAQTDLLWTYRHPDLFGPGRWIPSTRRPGSPPVTKQATRGGKGQAGQDGGTGKPGLPSGDIFILCDSLSEGSDLKLICHGGTGGRGQQGQDGGNGGQGGAGLDAWVANQIRTLTKAEDHLKSAMPGAPGGDGGDGGIGGPGGPGGRGGNCTLIVNHKLNASTRLEHSSEGGTSGSPGFGGAGGPAGLKGQDGTGQYAPPNDQERAAFTAIIPQKGEGGDERLKNRPGAGKTVTPGVKWGRYLVIANCQSDSEVKSREQDNPVPALRGSARVSYLSMLLETARLQYLQWDALRFAQAKGADDLKRELQARFAFLGFGLDLLPKFVSEEDARVHAGIGATLARLRRNLDREWDYFGKSPDDVPLGSPDIYLEPFNRALTLLQQREATYLAYVNSLADAKSLSEQRDAAMSQADEHLRAKEAEYIELRIALISLIREKIPAADAAVTEAKNNLTAALDKLKEWVKHCFSLTVQDFTSCLFNLAFVGDPTAPHGKFSTVRTVGSQTIGLIDKAINTLPNDDGQPVSRKHLLLKVDAFTKKLSKLDEAWVTIQNARNASGPDTIALNRHFQYLL